MVVPTVGVSLLAMVLALGGGQASAEERKPHARAELRSSDGKPLGQVRFDQTPSGVLIEGDLQGLPPGEHAMHLHEVAACTPNFEAAGDHYAPHGGKHGFRDNRRPHAGDLPNIYVAENGRARFEMRTKAVTLSHGWNTLFDRNGTAVVIHAKPDDHQTDPAGGAGARIACGVIQQQESPED